MVEYVGCRECDSPDCKGCNLKNLETMLRNGKFDCIMNENRCINTFADIAQVVYGQWGTGRFNLETGNYEEQCTHCRNFSKEYDKPYCPNCGAKMNERNEPEN